MTVYVLQHERTSHETADVKFIGVYSSAMNAEAAASRLGEQPGFSSTPDGFQIDPYVLEDHWGNGFGFE